MKSDDRKDYDSVVSSWENEGGAPAALPNAELKEEPGPRHPKNRAVIPRNALNTSAAPVGGRVKPSTGKLKGKSALSKGLIRSERLLGTLHLSPLVWPR